MRYTNLWLRHGRKPLRLRLKQDGVHAVDDRCPRHGRSTRGRCVVHPAESFPGPGTELPSFRSARHPTRAAFDLRAGPNAGARAVKYPSAFSPPDLRTFWWVPVTAESDLQESHLEVWAGCEQESSRAP